IENAAKVSLAFPHAGGADSGPAVDLGKLQPAAPAGAARPVGTPPMRQEPQAEYIQAARDARSELEQRRRDGTLSAEDYQLALSRWEKENADVACCPACGNRYAEEPIALDPDSDLGKRYNRPLCRPCWQRLADVPEGPTAAAPPTYFRLR